MAHQCEPLHSDWNLQGELKACSEDNLQKLSEGNVVSSL